MIYNLPEIFKTLATTNSVKEKEAFLRTHIDNIELQELLATNLDPNRLYQFNVMPITYQDVHTYDKFSESSCFKMFMTLIGELETRKVTGNAAKQAVKDVFCRMDTNEFEMYSNILLKGPIGVGASTVNKVWPELIPEFDLMLAPNELPNITDLIYPLYVQPKLDGYRCVYKLQNLISRAGKSFGNSKLAEYFKSLWNLNDHVLDGELYVKGISFNKLQKILNTHDTPLPKGLKFVVYDCIPIKDWEAQRCKKPYSDRLIALRGIVNGQLADHSKIIDIPNDLVNSPAELMELYKKYLKEGYEGAMMKSIEGTYKWKRVTLKSGEMVKLKPFETVDLKITGVYEGTNKNEGKAGGFLVDYYGVTVRVGSGLPDPLRAKAFKTPDEYIGKTIEVRYLEETEDGSLRHPSFKRFRKDKDQ